MYPSRKKLNNNNDNDNHNNDNNNNEPYFVRVTLNSKADKPVAFISRLNWNLECWFLWKNIALIFPEMFFIQYFTILVANIMMSSISLIP